MAAKWRMIRIPVELADRLDRLARHAERAHIEGKIQLPNEMVCHCPHHYVITQALDNLEGHRTRSRAPRRRSIGTRPDVRPGGTVYTSPSTKEPNHVNPS
jgi:hypothetical protein